MDRWVGKVAIVTGAANGIGASIAEKLVELGLKVVGFDLKIENLQESAKKLSDKKGKLFALKTDITKETDIKDAIKWTTENVGPISILVNNAGVLKLGGLLNGTAEDWKELLETNVLGLCIITKEVIHNMKANNIDGHIVNLNSICGHEIPNIQMPGLYPPSKYAVTALTEVLRIELVSKRSKIKVTSVSPGYVNTMMSRYAPQGTALLSPEDVAFSVISALSTPPHVQVCEMTIRHVEEVI